MDLNLRTVYVTPSIEAVLGFTQEERLRQSVEEQLTPQSLTIARETLARERVFEGQTGYLTRKVTLTLEFYHRDGSTRWLETIVSGLFDDQDRLTGLYGVSRDVTERKKTEALTLQYSEDLRERNKELQCLYSVSELVRKEETSQEDILSASASLLAQAYFYPEITGCRILWEDRESKTENFAPTSWMQTSAIRVRGKEVGKIEVCYLELRPEKDEGPFLKEERKFLDGIAELLGKSYERRLAAEEREKLIGELQNALQEVKTLTGLLPICASCKKIRNDQGYWERIERYIGERSSVQFSHGICPECAQKLYPDLNLKK
jgi:PAS domain S-box-containing protein